MNMAYSKESDKGLQNVWDLDMDPRGSRERIPSGKPLTQM